MNLMNVRQRLHEITENAGGIRAWIRLLEKELDKKDVPTHGYVAAVRRGDSKPGKKILKAMGLRKSFSAKKTTVMKFEDI